MKIVTHKELRLTKRALDAGESTRFSSVFFALAFFSVDGFAVPAPAQVTQAVRCGQRNEINYKRQCWVECLSNARPGIRERSNPFLARPRELRGRMVKGIIPIKSPHLTKRAPDGWESARFQAVCVAPSWFRQSGVLSSRPRAGNAHR